MKLLRLLRNIRLRCASGETHFAPKAKDRCRRRHNGGQATRQCRCLHRLWRCAESQGPWSPSSPQQPIRSTGLLSPPIRKRRAPLTKFHRTRDAMSQRGISQAVISFLILKYYYGYFTTEGARPASARLAGSVPRFTPYGIYTFVPLSLNYSRF